MAFPRAGSQRAPNPVVSVVARATLFPGSVISRLRQTVILTSRLSFSRLCSFFMYVSSCFLLHLQRCLFREKLPHNGKPKDTRWLHHRLAWGAVKPTLPCEANAYLTRERQSTVQLSQTLRRYGRRGVRLGELGELECRHVGVRVWSDVKWAQQKITSQDT